LFGYWVLVINWSLIIGDWLLPTHISNDVLPHCFVPVISAGVKILTLLPEINVCPEDIQQPLPDKYLFNIHQKIGRFHSLQLPIPVAAQGKQPEVILYMSPFRKRIQHV
jgi:hypothetical protein